MENADYKFMGIALEMAGAALARRQFPVGCVIAADGRVISRGKRDHSRGQETNELDHAEITAIRGLTIPIDRRRGLTLYSTMEPCLMCYATIILNRIPRVVYAYEDLMGGGTATDLGRSAPLYRDAVVKIIPGIRRRESLDLFARFFRDPDNDYWQGSQLARYTLEEAGNEG